MPAILLQSNNINAAQPKSNSQVTPEFVNNIGNIKCKNTMASVIQKAWKTHQQILKQKPVNEVGFKELKRESKSVDSNTKPDETSYFYNSDNKLVGLTPKGEPNNQASGSFKSLDRADDRFVQLKVNTDDSSERDGEEFNEFSTNTLTKYPSVTNSVFVRPDLVIAENGGETLNSKILDGEKVPLGDFKQICADLKTMHQDRVFANDIKPENMTIKDGTNMVRHIDTDGFSDRNRVDSGGNEIYPILYTPIYRPDCLNSMINSASYKWAEAGQAQSDNYALLVSMIESTQGKFVSSNRGHLGGLTTVDMKRLDVSRWINNNIKPEYQKDADKMLTYGRVLSPLNHDIDKPLADQIPNLVDMIKWSS
ncbi:hypothetical protein EJ063_07550 [Vibrio aquaticus]|uniref:Uncharacterized protein n=1 Tax=Vibrio aquaticus TaxID=2496559 RepID=A0A3S0MPF8_9VIBR|nr:serine/threonine-protein kinase [Vibrio aquaticus]RTZ16641.1 hypothetical protein EJ063_07550 [Vibrio aquaticus]